MVSIWEGVKALRRKNVVQCLSNIVVVHDMRIEKTRDLIADLEGRAERKEKKLLVVCKSLELLLDAGFSLYLTPVGLLDKLKNRLVVEHFGLVAKAEQAKERLECMERGSGRAVEG